MNTWKFWYAVQEERTDDWSRGSYDIDEAIEMLKEQGHGLLAVIIETEDESNCIDEWDYEEVFC